MIWWFGEGDMHASVKTEHILRCLVFFCCCCTLILSLTVIFSFKFTKSIHLKAYGKNYKIPIWSMLEEKPKSYYLRYVFVILLVENMSLGYPKSMETEMSVFSSHFISWQEYWVHFCEYWSKFSIQKSKIRFKVYRLVPKCNWPDFQMFKYL